MPHVIENQTAIEGIVVSRRPHVTLRDFDCLALAVSSVSAVPGKADLLSARLPGPLSFAVRREWLPAGDLRGWALRAQITLAGPDLIRAVGVPASFHLEKPPAP
jgi:hypothetical protein